MDWYRVREQTVSGETHYKTILDAARVRKKSYEEGRRVGLAEGTARLGWNKLETSPGLHRFMDTVRRVEG